MQVGNEHYQGYQGHQGQWCNYCQGYCGNWGHQCGDQGYSCDYYQDYQCDDCYVYLDCQCEDYWGYHCEDYQEATRASDTWGLAVRGLLVLVSALVSGLLGHEGLSLAATARISISTSVRRTKTIRIIGIRIWTSQIQAKSSQNRIKIKSNQNQIKILIES